MQLVAMFLLLGVQRMSAFVAEKNRDIVRALARCDCASPDAAYVPYHSPVLNSHNYSTTSIEMSNIVGKGL